MPKLKVFRTAAGFHDAYVAAPSRAAALRAWGSDADLFARGIAEEVTEPALTAAALARPGEVIRVSRGTAAEQLAAIERTPPRTKKASGGSSATRAKPKPKAPPKPKPSRHKLVAAEEALAAVDAAWREERDKLAVEQHALDVHREKATAAHERARAKLDAALDKERRSYEAALEAWRG